MRPFKTLRGWFSKSSSRSWRRRDGRATRKSGCLHLRRPLIAQQLEPRTMLNASPVAVMDGYGTAVITALDVGSGSPSLKANDWDPEGSSLTISIVTQPANGTISNLNTSAGTLTYTPDNNFQGIDQFQYKANDGTSDSNVVDVFIAVGGSFGPRTNGDERVRESPLLAGGLQLAQRVLPGVELIHNSLTMVGPIVAVDTYLSPDANTPDEIEARLTFDGSPGSTYSYDSTGLSPGDPFRVALQLEGSLPADGHYEYSLRLTAIEGANEYDTNYTGSADVVNRNSSSHPFGRGWQLAGLDRLVIDTGGALLVKSTGEALWFAEDGSGGFLPAEGDATFSELVENLDGSFTLATRHGEMSHFDEGGFLTAREDRNGNTIEYAYTNGLLTLITDPFGRETELAYTNGRLTSVTDFAGRTATLDYDGSGRLDEIVEVDPDGQEELESPIWTFVYDATSHLLTSRTNPLEDATAFAYGSHGRLLNVTHPDTEFWELVSLQTRGLPTGATGNALASADPTGTFTNENSRSSTFRTDRFGNIVQWTNPLSETTTTERNADGLPIRITTPDPDGAGQQTSAVTVLGYSGPGDLVYLRNPDNSTRAWTYTNDFHLVETATDELEREWSFEYDAAGNLELAVDPAGFETAYTYTLIGQVETITREDPDGAGPEEAPVTELGYDEYGRLETITFADATTQSFTYNSADCMLTATDELGHDTSYAWDALDRLTSVTIDLDATTSAVTSFSHDAMGNVVAKTDPMGNTTDYEFNSRGWVISILDPDPDGETGELDRPEHSFEFDGVGNLVEVGKTWILPGSTITYGYDWADRLASKTGPQPSASVTYQRDAMGRVTRSVEQGIETNYEYSSRSWVTKILREDPDGSGPQTAPFMTYSHNAAGETTSVTDFRGYTTDLQYDERGLLIGILAADPDGSGPGFRSWTQFEHDPLGRLVEKIDPLGRSTLYAYDARDRLIEVTLPQVGASSPVIELGYDDAGRRTSQTDPLGRVTAWGYNYAGWLTGFTQADPDGALGPLSAPVTEYAYNLAGSLTSITDPRGSVTAIDYDALQRQISITQEDPGAGAPVTTFEYNSQGMVSLVTDPLGRETSFQYDDYGRRTGITDNDGNVTTLAYNNRDEITSITSADPDGAGELTSSTTSFTFDIYGRRSVIMDAEGGMTSFTYDANDNLIALRDPENNDTTWAYDPLGRVAMETNELNKARSFAYDAASNLTRKVDRNGRVTQYVYDDLDRLTEEEWRTSATPVPSVSISTTTNGGGAVSEVQRVGFTHTGMGASGTFTLTFDGQTTSAIAWNASAATVQSALEALSNIGTGDVSVTKIQDVTQAQEWEITFQNALLMDVPQTTINTANVTPFGGSKTDIQNTQTEGSAGGDEVQVVTLNNATSGTFRLAFQGYVTAPIAYNAAASAVESALEELPPLDNVTVTGSAGGPWTITFGGTLTEQNVPTLQGDAATAGSGTLARTLSYEYDLASQLTAASDPAADYAFSYDNLGRATSITATLAGLNLDVELLSEYDAASNRTSLSAIIDTTDDFINTYTYDALNRLTRLTQEGQTGGNAVAEKRIDLAYNALEQFTEIVRYKDTSGGSANEVATALYTYDTLNRLIELAYQQDSADLFTPYEWAYDNMNRITQFTSQDGTSDYTYDKTSQLTAADHSYQTDEEYSYDDNGNRTNTGYDTGDNNQLLSNGVYDYEFDDEGNRTKRTHNSSGAVTEYEWDHHNRLVSIIEREEDEGDAILYVDYAYDVFDRRISKSIDPDGDGNDPAESIYFVYDGVHIARKAARPQAAIRHGSMHTSSGWRRRYQADFPRSFHGLFPSCRMQY